MIMSYVTKEFAKEEAAAALAEFKARKWCRVHGFQRVLPLEHPPGSVREYCIKCLAYAMAKPIRTNRVSRYERKPVI